MITNTRRGFMKHIKQNLSLDMIEISHNVVNARENDKLIRDLDITITERGYSYPIQLGAYVYVRGKRADGKSVFYSAEITDPDLGKIHVNIHDYLLSTPGRCTLDIGVYNRVQTKPGNDADEIASTEPFILYVPEGVFDEDDVVNSDEGSTLAKLINSARDEIAEMNALEADVTNQENIRKNNETERQTNESNREANEIDRNNNEINRNNAENERKNNETARNNAENVRNENETKRQDDTSEAIDKANDAAEKAEQKAIELQNKLDSHEIVLADDLQAHNSSLTAHNDVRDLISGLTIRLNALADSDDTTLDQLSEIIAYIKNNKSLIDGVTTSKVNKSGDTMTGKLNAHGGISLNGTTTSSDLQYILGCDAFAQGGTIRYQNASEVSVGKLGGLDADLFFCARTTGGKFTGDIDTAYSNGAYWCQNAANKPTNDPYGLLIVHAAGTTDVIKHTYIPHIGNGLMGAARERIRVNNIWSPWRLVDTTYSNATTSANGLMSSTDKIKLNNLNASSYLGNGTGFVRPNYIGGSANLNDYTKEWHGFVYNMSNMPSGEYYGFLDVTWFDGAGFTPAPPNGDKGGVVRQIFTSWDTGIMYTRVRPNNTWTAWRAIQTEGSNLVCGDYFYMTDNGGRKRIVLQAIEDGSGASNYGMQLVMGAGGNTFIGSGESASALYTALQTESNKKTNEVYAKGGENMFILSDGHLYLYSNANIVANRKGLCFSNAGILSPVGSDNISFGTLDSPFYDVFATNLRLKPKGANYGSKLLFGDSEYVYLHEDSDDHLLIHANRGAVFEINDAGKIEFGKKQSYSTGSSTQMSYPCWIMPNGDFIWKSAVGQPLATKIGSEKVQATFGDFYGLSTGTYLTVGNVLRFSTSGGERIEYDSHMLKLYAQSGIVFGSYIKSDICPVSGGTFTLGKSNDRWKEIWCSTSLNTSSDRNLKKNISDLSSDSRYIEFFMLLQPKSYLFKDGESGRTHVGFISQDVEEAMAECGLSSLEFAGFCKDQKIEVEEIVHPADEEAGEEEWIERKEHPVFDGDGNPVYEYSLRYEEFIALNTMMIQSQQEEISKIKEMLSDIKYKICSL